MTTDKPILLVVDDEPELVEFATLGAENVGYLVYSATNGQDFKQTFQSQNPSLILMDVAMPDIDGVELIEWLQGAGSQTPIVLMSGYGEKMLSWAQTLAADMGIPVVATLNKPFTLEELQTILSEAIPAT